MVPRYVIDDFKRFFRMGQDTFEHFCIVLHGTDEFQTQAGGRPAISLQKQTLVFLWYLGSLDTLIQIADRFGITEFSVIEIRRRMVRALGKLKSVYIRWPTGDIRQENIHRFEFPNTVGALDGTQIKIQAPRDNPTAYYNRKGFHSIVLQAVRQYDMRFTDCYVGWPGSVHDARVLRNSDLWEKGLECCGNAHILADAAYPLRRWLMTPYRNTGNLTRQQTNFNTKLSKSRVVIERTFGLFKGRFRRMQFLNLNGLQEAADLIISTCVTHNICIIRADVLEDFAEEELDEPAMAVLWIVENNAEGALR